MTNVTINKKLNLVIPIEEDEKIKAWIFSTPLAYEIFEANYLLLIRTLSYLYANGIGPLMAIRVARLALKDVAKQIDDEKDISIGLMNEIERITTVLRPDEHGRWKPIPYGLAKTRGFISSEKIREVENAIVYFTVASAVHLEDEMPMAYQGLKQIWKAQTTSLSDTEYGNSLPTSTPTESTGEKVPDIIQRVAGVRLSSIPS
jgi:hypothetical protein